MAELRLHGAVKPADVKPPVTTDDAPQGWSNKDVSVTFTATDAESGVAATYFTVDGGAQQTGNTVSLSDEGAHTLAYWSADWAGNAEQPHTAAVNIDKTAPTITVSGLVYGSYSDSMDVTPVVALSDTLSGGDDSKTTVTLSTYGTMQPVQSGAAIALYTLPLGSHTLTVTASDMAGNTASRTVVFQTAASIDSMKALVTRFANAGWIDNAGIANSLQSKLKANALAALVNEVQAQRGKHISNQAADYLLRDAENLLPEQ
jgi:hypothetical protein